MISSRRFLLVACTIVADVSLAAPALGQTPHGTPPPPAVAKKNARPKPIPPPPPARVAVSEPPDRASPRPIVLDLAVGGGTLSRRLQYKDDLFGAFKNSVVRLGAQASGALVLYPFAPLTRGFFANLGLYGDVSHSIGLTTNDGSGGSLPTLVVAYDLGLRVRIPIGSVELDPTGGYGRQQFEVGTLPGSPSPGPNYDLGFLFADLHGRWQAAGPLSLLFDGAYLGVIQNGLATTGYFPRSKVAGLRAGGGLGLTLIEALELRLIVSYQRFFYSMHPEPGDAHVVGGATDEYLWGTLALAFLIH